MTEQTLHPAAAAAPYAARRRRRQVSVAALLVLIVAGPLLLAALRLFPALDQTMMASPLFHLLISGAAALLGVGLALMVTATGIRINDARIFLIGLGLLSISELFIIHAISTPNVIVQGHGAITGWTALMSLVVGGMLLAISSLELGQRSNGRIMRYAGWLALLLFLFWLVVGAITLEPWRAEPPDHQHHVASVAADTRGLLVMLGVACYLFAAARYWRIYQRQPSSTAIALGAGVALFCLALITQWQTRAAYSLSFWLYHAQEFAAFGVISAAILRGYRSGMGGEGLLESLLLSGTRARLEAGYISALEALIDTLGRGERPGAPQRRELQERFRLSESQMRALEQAAGAVAVERRQRQELERLNQQLVQLQRDKEQLTQMVVHDLKNPLTAMIGFLEILQRSASELDDDQRTLLDYALRSGKNLSTLIGDLLDAARLGEGRLELDYGQFDPADLLRECAAQMGAWLIQDEKTLKIEAAEDLTLVADRRLLRRVLLNLISNAIKHTPPGTTVVLRARRGDGAVIFEVEDNGHGIAPEKLGQIFERFSQVSTSEGRQHNTGLGLSFCRLAVEAHGGAISVERAPVRGALFRATVPAEGRGGALRGRA